MRKSRKRMSRKPFINSLTDSLNKKNKMSRSHYLRNLTFDDRDVWRTDSSRNPSDEFEMVGHPTIVTAIFEKKPLPKYRIIEEKLLSNDHFYHLHDRKEDIRFFTCMNDRGEYMASCTVYPSELRDDIPCSSSIYVYYPYPRRPGKFEEIPASRIRNTTLKVEDVQVDPSFRGRGLCAKFLSEVGYMVKTNPELYHYNFLYINSYKDNIPARQCYNRFMQWPKRRNVHNTGFTLIDTDSGLPIGAYWITPLWAF